MRPQDVIEWWRMSRASVIETLAKSSPGKKLHGGKMKLIVEHLQ